jgi:hypothetical protein
MPTFKYPVPRLAAQAVSEWADEIAAHLACSVTDVLEDFTAVMKYPLETVRIELMDGSSAEFKCSFFIASDAKKAIAVFTEHCGHHIFPYHEAKVLIDGKLVYEQ